MTFKKVAAGDLIEAAERNGYRHSQNGWFSYEMGLASDTYGYGTSENPIVAACFMGQVAINLGVDYTDLKYELDTHYGGLGRDIVRWNDNFQFSYDEIFKRFKDRLKIGRGYSYGPIEMETKNYIAKRKDEV